MDFPHLKLDAYQAAADFVVLADTIAQELPRGRAYLVDQLRRASLSIPANIAEGAGEFSPSDKARFYRMALRSASECAALLDACKRMKLGEADHLDEAVAMLDRVMAMVTGLVTRFVGSG
jgi:four helix bundle protein